MNIVWNIEDYSNNEGGVLASFSVTGEVPEVIEEFIIPSVVDGKHIFGVSMTMKAAFEYLWESGVKQIKRFIVENGIKYVENWAFAYIRVKIDEFYWPSTCDTIPVRCFLSSAICEIKGIDHVKQIEHDAFAHSKIGKIVWPAKCNTIPEACFFNSNLKEIIGIENLEVIRESAFESTELETFVWPQKCKVIPSNCFRNCTQLVKISGIEKVEGIGFQAFENTSLREFLLPLGVKVPKVVDCFFFLSNCRKLRRITFAENSGILEVDLNLLASLKKVEVIDLSKVAVVNFINTNSRIEPATLYEKVRNKLILPYYVAGI